MLSAHTTKNIEEAFYRAAAATLVRNPGDACEIVPAKAGVPDGKAATKLLMITLSSFTFRLVTVFQLSQEKSTHDYYTCGARTSLDEVFAEVANMCCGAFGRELSSGFRNIAMSIPYPLDSQCASLLATLEPRFQASYDITINGAARIRTTLCLSCNRPIEFVASAAATVSHAGGELELF